ncbi:hypothetical protein OSH11_11805 [Kaistia dalseonensis]|uniref:GcrA cell cycle regulator n=1 Tax=Kaistia dalseonensis TaxID=410840 RepID=A0ABU0H935_9HYPH|nr:hypothetical protein [Kaistia dalseonensis]MCX5495393.1 hypothetical protein [Kaistia dalseonensis]MDQ0437981.1 hypothetical protein [Kaistia dalseonensis]
MTGWTEDQVADLRDYVGLGYPLDQIIAETGRLRGEVEAKLAEVGIPASPPLNLVVASAPAGRAEEGSRPTPAPSSANHRPWGDMSTAATIAAIQSGLAEGLSFAAIGARHGATRSAVSGFVMRNRDAIGVEKREAGSKAPAPRPPRAPAARLPATKKVRRPARTKRVAAPSIVTPVPAPRRAAVLPASPVLPTGTHRVSFLKSREFVCKVLLPEEPVTHYGMVCGNPVPPGRKNRVCDACSTWFFSRVTVKLAEELATARDARRRVA